MGREKGRKVHYFPFKKTAWKVWHVCAYISFAKASSHGHTGTCSFLIGHKVPLEIGALLLIKNGGMSTGR